MGGSATCGPLDSNDELGDGGTYPPVPPDVEPPPDPDPLEPPLPVPDDFVGVGEGDGFAGVREVGFLVGFFVGEVVGVGVCEGGGFVTP
jgi:hypothetical protein